VFGDQVFEGAQAERNEKFDIKSLLAIAASSSAANRNQLRTSAPVPAAQQTVSSLASDDGAADTSVVEPVAQKILQAQASLLSTPAIPGVSAPESNAVALGLAPFDLAQPSLPAILSAIAMQQIHVDNADLTQGSCRSQSIDLSRFSDFVGNPSSLNRAPDSEVFSDVTQSQDGHYEMGIEENSAAKVTLLMHSVVAPSDLESYEVAKKKAVPIEAERGAWREYSTETSRTADQPPIVDLRKSVAPQARRHEPQAPIGDVYLDGMLVGRWVSRFLQKQAERADVGPTGFDAKRGRLLPGVTVGG
jgi:hypothetical protein